MEIELKYQIPDINIAEQLKSNAVFSKYGHVDSETQKHMDAIYYDTEDCILQQMEAAFRIRKEGEHTVATIKWGGKQESGLYEREEINVRLNDSYDIKKPTLDCFSESEQGSRLIELVDDKRLIPIIETDFVRYSIKVDSKSAIWEAAVDIGKVVTPAGEDAICELEIELYSGDIEKIKYIGSELEKKFELHPGTVSKYGRGLALLRNAKFD